MLLPPGFLLQCYRDGEFPMADAADGEIAIYACPDPRAIIEPETIRPSRSLRRTIARGTFTVRIDTAFEEVMRACAERQETWISEDIIASYMQLHELGHAHSVESWQGGMLAGGLYGVAIGGAFFGESMFHRATDASKVAFIALAGRMASRGMPLLDAQFMTPHLQRLGAILVPREEYMRRLHDAVGMDVSFA